MRQFVLKNKEREKRNKQIESEIKEKRKTKKNYSQKSKTIYDRERMIKYFNEQRIIARIKNVDRAAWLAQGAIDSDTCGYSKEMGSWTSELLPSKNGPHVY